MSFASRARQVAAAVFKKSDCSSRDISKQTTIPKSSVYRHRTAMKKRMASVGHGLYETKIGYALLQRLYFAAIFVFGIVAGVGAETISIFFNMMILTSYLATSSTTIRNIKTQMRELITKYDANMRKKIFDLCKNKELHLGGDETFFDDKLFLI